MSFLLLSVFVGGFVLGVLAIVAVEAAGVLFVIQRLAHKTKKAELQANSEKSNRDVDPQQSLDFAFNKQGVVWILESDEDQKSWLVEKVPKEQKRKMEFLEVFPVRRYGKIKDDMLILTDTDGSQATIRLKGCIIVAVSATSLSSRKWAKRFPIKIEHKTSAIYKGSRVVYIYLETSWEKESWCKALRLASCEDKERLNWFTKLGEEFHNYMTLFHTGYPSFMKPSVGLVSEQVDKGNRLDGASSKVRLIWKKLSRKASKSCLENKGIWMNPLGLEEKKISEKLRIVQDSLLGTSWVKTGPTTKVPGSSMRENTVSPSSSTFSHSGSQSHVSVTSDVESEDKFNIDEGTLCWNLLISRLFFDAKCNAGLKSSILARIQRTLSNMRTPSYIGEIICTDIDTGNLPPYLHSMRVLPADMNEIWAFEVDVEYSGGAVLDVETRLEVHELDLQKGIDDTNTESSSAGDVSSDLLEGFEYFGKQLNLSEGNGSAQDLKDERDAKHGTDELKDLKSTIPTSRWKSILNSIAKQVSQVPLSLSIRVASLRGTVRLHIKPPPTDQLWFGFTSMPDIEFVLESSIGEHKVTSGHIALFLISRFKAAIRETMVLPNCESVCVPWMLAEKDDWVPRRAAPFLWLNQEAGSNQNNVHEPFSSPSGEAKAKTEASRGNRSDHPGSKHQKLKKVECSQQPISVPMNLSTPASSSTTASLQERKSLQELKTPLLTSTEPQEDREEITGCQSPYGSLTQLERQNIPIEQDESKLRKMGRKARMLDLGKKMGEKLEEKRRHIEEKGRHIVEKMRGP